MLKENIELDNKTVFITGAAGFIGAALSSEIEKRYPGAKIVGIDNMNSYYEVSLKEYRLAKLGGKLEFIKGNIADKELLMELFGKYRPEVVINLAAQAGVRYSIENPDAYIESNILGFYNILEACRKYPVEHLVYASSSSAVSYTHLDVYKRQPSLHEGLPLVLLEAQDSGIICICSENITKEADKTGLLRFLPLGSPENWADEMASVKAGDREKQSLLARERMKKEGLDIDDAAKKLLDFYREERQEFRVAVVAHNLTAGGAERVVARLLNSWAESGVN